MQYVAIIYKILPELLSQDHPRFFVFDCYLKYNCHLRKREWLKEF